VHLLGAVAPAGRRVARRQPEPLGPAVLHPDLVVAAGGGEMIVLDPGQVPDQPADGIRLLRWAVGELGGGQAAGDAAGHFADSVKAVDQQVSALHPTSLSQYLAP